MGPPQMVRDLLAELDALGCLVLVRDGRPQVTQPTDPAKLNRFKVLLPFLRIYRDEVLAHFRGADGEGEAGGRCDVCGGWVYADSPEVQRLCHMVNCPLWKVGCGVGPPWLGKERSQQQYRERNGNTNGKGRK